MSVCPLFPSLLFLRAVSSSSQPLALFFSFALCAPVSHTPGIHSGAIFAHTFSSLPPKTTHLWINTKHIPATLPKKHCHAEEATLLQPLSLSAESLLLMLVYAYRIWPGNSYDFCASDSAVKCKGKIIKNTFFLLRVIYCFLLVGCLFWSTIILHTNVFF